MATQSNIQILEALLNRELQSEQTEEINNLKKLNSYCPKDPDRIFILDEDETPNMIGYLNPKDPDMDSSILEGCSLILDFMGIKIYKLN